MVSKSLLKFCFWSLWLIAPIFQYFYLTESFFAGTMFVVFSFVMIYLTFNITKLRTIKKTFLIFFSLFFSLLILQIIIGYFLFPQETNFTRGLSSLFALAVFILGAYFFSELIVDVGSEVFNNTLLYLCIAMIFIGLLSFIEPVQRAYGYSVFPFTEPSHYGIFLLGPLFYVCLIYKKYRIYLLTVSLILALIMQSLTTIVGVTLFIFASYRIQSALIVGIAITLAYNYLDLSYYTGRLNFSKNSDNLSTLVFLQGWELMYEGLKKSYGFGIGFQQLGEVNVKTFVGDLIYTLQKEDANIRDAGLTAAKLMCETGYFGVVIIAFYIKYFILAFINFGKTAFLNQSKLIIFANCFLLSYFVELFVRGFGYFDGTSFMAFVSIFILNNSNITSDHLED